MQKLTKLKISWQLGIILSLPLGAILIINFLVGARIGNLVLEKNVEYADSTAEKYVREMCYTRDKALSVMNFFQYSEQVQEYFRREKTSSAFPIFDEMERYLTSVRIIYPELADIGLIGAHENRTLIRDRDLHAILQRHPGSMQLACDGILEITSYDLPSYKVLIYTRNLYGGTEEAYARPIGQCVLGIRFTQEDFAAGSAAELPDTSFLVLDRRMNYYAVNCGDDTAREICGRIDPENLTALVDNKEVLLKVHPVPDSELYIVSCTDKQALFQDVWRVQALIGMLCAVIVTLLLMVVMLIRRNMLSPIYRLREYMHRMTQGSYTCVREKAAAEGSLEMAELAEDLNALITEFEERSRRLFATTNRMYEMELEKRSAEVSFLKSQINPHFLYNSLEIIQGICMKNHVTDGAEVANALGRIFRYSIKGENVVSFREELEVTRAYVNIQRARFPHKAEVLYGIQPETLEMPVIKMILQPLVENAFSHAVEKSVTKVTLYIASARIGEELVLTVQDDGPGIPPETLAELKAALDNEQVVRTGSIGLVNVHLRIRLYYGPAYGLTLESTPGEGTKVTLRLPASPQEETREERGSPA